MELRSSFTFGTHDVQFDKQLLKHFKQNENEAAQAILQRNTDLLKSVDNDGFTLLHHATRYRNIDMIQHLIDSGIDVNVQDRRGRTALMIVRSDRIIGSDPIIEMLLGANAYVHLRDNTGKSGLQFICMVCNNYFPCKNIPKLCVRNLIAYYSDDNDKLAKLFLECKDPLFHLLYAENPMITRSLLKKGYPVNTNTSHGKTALHIAVKNNDLEHVKILVEYGAEVNAMDEHRVTPLGEFRESHRGSYKTLNILKLLLDKGAVTTALVITGTMQVEGLLNSGSEKEIQLLRKYNLNLRAKDKFEQTALHLLALNDCENVFEELQGMDFNVDARDCTGRTPLHCAIGNSSSVNFLLKNGADVNAVDQYGFTPLHLAFDRGTDKYEIMFKTFVCDVRVVESLLESGADPQAESLHGETVIARYMFSYWENKFTDIKPVLAHLAMLQARGVVLKKLVRYHITGHTQMKKCYISYRRKLEQMENVNIWESLTLYDLLMKSEEQLAVYMRNRQLVLKLVHISKKYIPHSNYYFDFIRRRVQKILQNVQVKGRAAVIISKLMKLNYGASHMISDRIVSYLNYNDLLTLVLLQET